MHEGLPAASELRHAVIVLFRFLEGVCAGNYTGEGAGAETGVC